MNKIFTLFVAFVCSTIMYAQTPAQELAESSFSGKGSVSIKGKGYDVASQTISFTLNAEDNTCVDAVLSDGTFKYSMLTITMRPEAIKKIKVTKSGSTYSLDSSKTFKVIMDNGSAQSDATGQFSASSIDLSAKKATLTLHLTNLSETIQKFVGTSVDATYDLPTGTVSGIEDITVETVKPNGKFVKNGKVIIRNNGVEYNVNGQKLF